VDDPSRYQAQFNVDGSLNIKADCNNVIASYTVGEGNSMTILPGPSTLMACPEDSQADAFMQQLGATAAYGFSSGALVLSQADPSLMMTFQMLPVAILPAPEANEPSAQTTTNVNLRSGPGENYTIYGVMPFGTLGEVVGKSEDGGWWALNMPVSPTGRGWASASYVTTSNADNVPVMPAPPVPPTVEPVAPGENDPQATVLQPANVRQGPGEAYPVYGTAQPGQTALVIGRSEDGAWWVVRVNPQIIQAGFAWVQASLVQAKNTENAPVIAAPPVPTGAPVPPPTETGAPMATATTAVNVRTGPSTDYPVLGVAQTGQSAEIAGVSQDGGWWQVRVSTSVSPDGLAWVSGAYTVAVNTANVPVVAAPPPPEPVETPPPPPTTPSGIWVITVEPLNVRAGPGNEYPSYGKIPAGVPLQVTGETNGWLSVVLPALPGGIGWISGNYVVPYTGAVATPY
jgi:N-acetylmuramoyl-L-alanine amidase